MVVGLRTLFPCRLSTKDSSQLLEDIYIPWLMISFFHLQSQRWQIKYFSCFKSFLSLIPSSHPLFCLRLPIQNNLPLSKPIILIISAKTLLQCKVTYSQAPRIKTWTLWRTIILPIVPYLLSCTDLKSEKTPQNMSWSAVVWMCPPKFICWKFNPQCNSVGRWSLVRGDWVLRALMNGLMLFLAEWVSYWESGLVIKVNLGPSCLLALGLMCGLLPFFLLPWDDTAWGLSSEASALLLDFPASEPRVK